MKKLLLCLAISSFTFSYLKAQITKKKVSATTSKEGKEDGDEKNKKPKYDAHWAGFDLGTLLLMNDAFSTDFGEHDYWKNNVLRSSNFNFNFLEYKIPILRQYIGLTTGLGLNFKSIAFREDYVLAHTTDSVYAVVDLTQTYRRNTLNSSYLTVPLMVDIATQKYQRNSFYFAAGLIGGMRIGSYTYRSGKFTNGDRFQNTIHSKYNLAPFTLEATVRIGYGAWGIYGTYQLNSLFKKGNTVAVMPISAGVTYNFSFAENPKKKKKKKDKDTEVKE